MSDSPAQQSPATDSGEQRRDKSKRRYREAILEAAVDVFAEKGYEAAQMGEIALRAGVAVGTLYNFFTSKENLYREMLMAHVMDIAMEFNEIFETADDPLTKLMRYIRHKGEVLQADRKLVRVYFSEVQASELQSRATRSEEFRQIYRRMMAKLAETFQEGIDDGTFVDADAFSMGIALSSITNSFIRLWMNHPDLKPSYPDRVETIAKIFFGPILKEASPPATNGAAATSSHSKGALS